MFDESFGLSQIPIDTLKGCFMFWVVIAMFGVLQIFIMGLLEKKGQSFSKGRKVVAWVVFICNLIFACYLGLYLLNNS